MKKLLESLNILLLTFVLLPMAASAQETGWYQESYQNLPFTTYINDKGESASIPEGENYYLLDSNKAQGFELTSGWYLISSGVTGTVSIADTIVSGNVNLVLGENSPIILNGNITIKGNAKLSIYAQNSKAGKVTVVSQNSQDVISGGGAFNNYSGSVVLENDNSLNGLCVNTGQVNCYGGSLTCLNQNVSANAALAASTRLSVYGGEFKSLTNNQGYHGIPIGTVPTAIKGNSIVASQDALTYQSPMINGILIALDSFDNSGDVNVYNGNGAVFGNVKLNSEGNPSKIQITNLVVTQGACLTVGAGQAIKTDKLQNNGSILINKGDLSYKSVSGEGSIERNNNGRNQNSNKAVIQDNSLNEPDDKATQVITGIKPAVESIYVSSSNAYLPINNLVTEPFEKPITDNVSFSSSSFQITSSGTGKDYKLEAPDADYNGNTIVTASYKSGSMEYSTSFSVNFVANADEDVKGIDVPEQLSFNLTDPKTQNVSATLMPENCTNYNQNIPYINLFTYTSSDPEIASVDNNGNITPKGVGSCVITTSYEVDSVLYEKDTEITVINENIGSITINPLLLNLNLENKKTGIMTANIYPDDLGLVPNWSVSNELIAKIKPNGLQVEITALSVGTVTITASCMGESVTATVRVTQTEIYPDSINVFPNAVYLATQGTKDATVFSVVTANLMPGEATGDITWTSDTDIFNFNPSPDGRTVSVVPKDKQGFGYLTATARGKNGEVISTKCPVTISNKPVVADAYRNYIENSLFTSDSPDSFKVNVYPIANPAMKAYEGKNVRQVTIFCWSNLGQTDLNCKVANYESDGHFSYTFPVNGNAVNNYFDRACNIKVSFYGSFEFENGNLINSFYYNYVTPSDFSSNVAVTPYIQNLGFELPTVGNDELAGTEGRHLQLEGLRLSSPIDGLELVYDVHVEDFGWTDQVSSGIYCGTMHLNKQIEAVHINLTGQEASQYTIRYQVHVEGIGWMDWVSDGAQAGTVGQHRQIEAIRVSIAPKT